MADDIELGVFTHAILRAEDDQLKIGAWPQVWIFFGGSHKINASGREVAHIHDVDLATLDLGLGVNLDAGASAFRFL